MDGEAASMRIPVLLAVATLLCAGCSGGGGAPVPPSATPSPNPATGPRAYAGTRTIRVTGSPILGAPGAATYAVSEIETDVPAGAGAPAGATLDRRYQIVYSGAPPASGVYLQSEQRDDYVSAGTSGLTLMATTDVVTGRDLDAEQHTPQRTQFIDTRTVATTYPAGAVIVPPTTTGGSVPFPLGSTTHIKELSAGTAGVGVSTFKNADYTRTTSADGSFAESGSLGTGETHAVSQNPDGSATSHDWVPGFYLRDVAVTAPAGRLAVTTRTQGRDIGDVPIVTSTYTTPVWYAPGTVATATLSDWIAATPSECGSTSVPTRRLSLARSHVDVTSGTQFAESDDYYVDAAGATLCHVTTDDTNVYDVTTGALVGSTTDTTSVHFTGPAPATTVSTRR